MTQPSESICQVLPCLVAEQRANSRHPAAVPCEQRVPEARCHNCRLLPAVAALLDTQLAQARAEERDICAQTVIAFSDPDNESLIWDIAAAIRRVK